MIVWLSADVASWAQASFQIAHEVVHLLDPRAGAASVLEEGLAVWTAAQYCAQFIPDDDPFPLPESYADAFARVQPLLADLGLLRSWRAAHPGRGFSDVTADELRTLYPTLDCDAAERLVAPFA